MDKKKLRDYSLYAFGISGASLAVIITLSVLSAPEAVFAPFIAIWVVTLIAGVGLWNASEDKKGVDGQGRKAVPPALRDLVFKRAGSGCQFPDCDEKGRSALVIHHVDMDRANSNDTDNLIAICPNHHAKLHNPSSGITIREVKEWVMGRDGTANGQRAR